MKKIIIFFFITLLPAHASTSNKEKIIKNLKNTNNITFNFEQNINGEIENGACVIQYPKKIYCKYDLKNQKILVSNGKLLVIKTLSSYYLYPLDKTKLNFILDKNFLLKKISVLPERIIDDKFINFQFLEGENEVNIFFDKKNYQLIGWQTEDVYQNLNITYLSSIKKNTKLKTNLFKLPEQN